LHLSGEISDEIVVDPYHHLVCEDDVTFVPGSRLEIQPNAVVRIAPGADLTIMGSFKAQGEEDNMFWVTSNDGFDNYELLMFNSKLEENYDPKNNSKLRIQNSTFIRRGGLVERDTLELYNSMELSDIATVVDDVIEWGKWSWGNSSLGLNDFQLIEVKDVCFNYTNRSLLLNDANNFIIQRGIFRNSNSNNDGTITVSNTNESIIKNNIFSNCDSALNLNNSYDNSINNNFINNCNYGIFNTIYSQETIITNNHINTSQKAIVNFGHSTVFVMYNNIKSNIGIDNIAYPNYLTNAIATVNENNLNCSNFSFRTTSVFPNGSIILDVRENYWGISYETEIQELIWDKNDADPNMVNYELLGICDYSDYKNSEIDNAGIK
jgi:hypothetical protein